MPQHRGQGHGLAVFNRAMARLEGRVIGLDAVAQQRHNYEKRGFVVAHQVVRFQGLVDAGNISAERPRSALAPDGLAIRELSEDCVQPVLDFDKKYFPAPRERLMRAWLTAPTHTARVVLDEDGVVLGYGVLRPCHEGARVAPLFATSAIIAEMLFWALAAEVAPRTKLTLDVPDANVTGLRMAERLGLNTGWHGFRMYRGTPPSLPLDHIFGITSLEIG